MNKRERLLGKCKGKPSKFFLGEEEIHIKPLTVRQFSDIMDQGTVVDVKGNVKNDVGLHNALCAIAMIHDPETGEKVFEETDLPTLLETDMNSPMWEAMAECQRLAAGTDENGKPIDEVTEAKNSLTETDTSEDSP